MRIVRQMMCTTAETGGRICGLLHAPVAAEMPVLQRNAYSPFDEPSAFDQNVYFLCEKEKRTKINIDEENNSSRMLLPADLSFAIDGQQRWRNE
jgi:hypothetical protein